MFATLIREYRKYLKISQEVMAEMLGISANHLSRIERGKVYPSGELIHSILELISNESTILEIPPQNVDVYALALLLHLRRYNDTDKELIIRAIKRIIYIISNSIDEK